LLKDKKNHTHNNHDGDDHDDDDDDTNLQLNPGLCFSIIFRGDWTLDLMMISQGKRDQVLDALDRVIQTYQNAKRQVSNEVLLLRYVWLDADKVRYKKTRKYKKDRRERHAYACTHTLCACSSPFFFHRTP
jgi:hypothetical protein